MFITSFTVIVVVDSPVLVKHNITTEVVRSTIQIYLNFRESLHIGTNILELDIELTLRYVFLDFFEEPFASCTTF